MMKIESYAFNNSVIEGILPCLDMTGDSKFRDQKGTYFDLTLKTKCTLSGLLLPQ